MAITDGIIGCWSPSLGASGYRLLDRSGRGNHGTLTNMDAGTDWVGTPVGLALDFDGANDFVQCGKAPVLTTRFAISLWFRPTALNTANKYLLSALNSSASDNSYSVIWEYVDNTVEFYSQGSAIRTNTQISVTDTVWTHICYSYTGSVIFAYKNGVQVNSQSVSTTLNANNGDLFFGTYAGSSFVPQAQMSEIGIYNRPLTAGEVLDLYRRGNGAIGRELTGRARRRTYGFVAAGFRPYWAARRTQVIGGGSQ
jgi:hypothetical protein